MKKNKHIVCYSGGHSSALVAIEVVKLFVNNQFLIFEEMKRMHFNIYDLPSEMYIEKSTVKKQ